MSMCVCVRMCVMIKYLYGRKWNNENYWIRHRHRCTERLCNIQKRKRERKKTKWERKEKIQTICSLLARLPIWEGADCLTAVLGTCCMRIFFLHIRKYCISVYILLKSSRAVHLTPCNCIKHFLLAFHLPKHTYGCR